MQWCENKVKLYQIRYCDLGDMAGRCFQEGVLDANCQSLLLCMHYVAIQQQCCKVWQRTERSGSGDWEQAMFPVAALHATSTSVRALECCNDLHSHWQH